MRGNALFFVMDVFSPGYPPDLQTGDSHAKASPSSYGGVQ
jgi:hypothetical protein